MKIHKLKLNAKYYEDSERGIKTFEIRKNDRDYKIGDVLELREYIEDIRGLGYYTGNVHWKIITYILDDDLYLAPGYVCLGLSPIAEPEGGRQMSDDLISRRTIKSLVETIRDCWAISPYVSANDMKLYSKVFNVVLNEISNCPTAFDKEKVIEELEDYLFDKYCIEGDWKVVEIVEKGGIE